MKIRNQSQPKIPRRMTAFLLFFSMLLPIFTFFPSYAADEAAEPVKIPQRSLPPSKPKIRSLQD